MKPFRFHAAARKEFRDAILFYDDRAAGLGTAFADEVQNAIRRILQMPTAWPTLSGNVRSCQLQRFPFGILYRESKAVIEIVAVMHQRRHPDSWKGR